MMGSGDADHVWDTRDLTKPDWLLVLTTRALIQYKDVILPV